MTLKFTQQHLLKYIYKETSATETLQIREALNNDWDLNEQYNEMLLAYRQLPKVTFKPSNNSIQNILRYSESSAVHPQH